MGPRHPAYTLICGWLVVRQRPPSVGYVSNLPVTMNGIPLVFIDFTTRFERKTNRYDVQHWYNNPPVWRTARGYALHAGCDA